ncbi:MAG: hypothetical protein NVS1B2_26510 [Vulcanimicrobiaceae bacterium]
MEQQLPDTRYRMEVIGDYVQPTQAVFPDNANRPVVVEAGRYPVVGSIGLADGRLNEAGVVFHGRGETGDDLTLLQFHNPEQLWELERSGTLELSAPGEELMQEQSLEKELAQGQGLRR